MRTEGAQAVRRAIDVIRTVAQLQRSGATLSRIAQSTNFSIPTAHRLLRSLSEERMLSFDPDDRSYRLGPLAFELGLAAAPAMRIEDQWREVVASIAARTRLTSYLIARSGNEAVCLHCAQGSTAIRAMPMEVGQRVPLGLGAGSLAILASLDEAEIGQVLASHKDRYDVFPLGQRAPRDIRQRIVETRARGFSISTGTVAAGVTGIGVVVQERGANGALAVTVSAVATTFGEDEARSLAAIIRGAIRERA